MTAYATPPTATATPTSNPRYCFHRHELYHCIPLKQLKAILVELESSYRPTDRSDLIQYLLETGAVQLHHDKAAHEETPKQPHHAGAHVVLSSEYQLSSLQRMSVRQLKTLLHQHKQQQSLPNTAPQETTTTASTTDHSTVSSLSSSSEQQQHMLEKQDLIDLLQRSCPHVTIVHDAKAFPKKSQPSTGATGTSATTSTPPSSPRRNSRHQTPNRRRSTSTSTTASPINIAKPKQSTTQRMEPSRLSSRTASLMKTTTTTARIVDTGIRIRAGTAPNSPTLSAKNSTTTSDAPAAKWSSASVTAATTSCSSSSHSTASPPSSPPSRRPDPPLVMQIPILSSSSTHSRSPASTADRDMAPTTTTLDAPSVHSQTSHRTSTTTTPVNFVGLHESFGHDDSFSWMNASQDGSVFSQYQKQQQRQQEQEQEQEQATTSPQSSSSAKQEKRSSSKKKNNKNKLLAAEEDTTEVTLTDPIFLAEEPSPAMNIETTSPSNQKQRRSSSKKLSRRIEQEDEDEDETEDDRPRRRRSSNSQRGRRSRSYHEVQDDDEEEDDTTKPRSSSDKKKKKKDKKHKKSKSPTKESRRSSSQRRSSSSAKPRRRRSSCPESSTSSSFVEQSSSQHGEEYFSESSCSSYYSTSTRGRVGGDNRKKDHVYQDASSSYYEDDLLSSEDPFHDDGLDEDLLFVLQNAPTAPTSSTHHKNKTTKEEDDAQDFSSSSHHRSRTNKSKAKSFSKQQDAASLQDHTSTTVSSSTTTNSLLSSPLLLQPLPPSRLDPKRVQGRGSLVSSRKKLSVAGRRASCSVPANPALEDPTNPSSSTATIPPPESSDTNTDGRTKSFFKPPPLLSQESQEVVPEGNGGEGGNDSWFPNNTKTACHKPSDAPTSPTKARVPTESITIPCNTTTSNNTTSSNKSTSTTSSVSSLSSSSHNNNTTKNQKTSLSSANQFPYSQYVIAPSITDQQAQRGVTPMARALSLTRLKQEEQNDQDSKRSNLRKVQSERQVCDDATVQPTKGIVMVISTALAVKQSVRANQHKAMTIFNHKLKQVPYDTLDVADTAYDKRKAHLLKVCHDTAGETPATSEYPLFFLVTQANTKQEDVSYKGNFEWFETAWEGGFLEDMLLEESPLPPEPQLSTTFVKVFPPPSSFGGGNEENDKTSTVSQSLQPQTPRQQKKVSVSTVLPSPRSSPSKIKTTESAKPSSRSSSMRRSLSSRKLSKKSLKAKQDFSPSQRSRSMSKLQSGPGSPTKSPLPLSCPLSSDRHPCRTLQSTLADHPNRILISLNEQESRSGFVTGPMIVLSTAYAIPHSVRINQHKALEILDQQELSYQVLDASNSNHDKERMQLLAQTHAAAGETAKYPHFYWVETESSGESPEIVYKGNFEWFQTAHEAGFLKSMVFRVETSSP